MPVVHRVARENTETGVKVRAKRALLFIAPEGSIAESLIYALERELPDLAVRQVDNVQAACSISGFKIPLILVDQAFFHEVNNHTNELVRAHPSALVALMQEDGHNPVMLSDVIASTCVRGILPMNLKLDVWLSIVRLMLGGGEYIPPTMLYCAVDPSFAARRSESFDVASGAERCAFDKLTDREAQILELVARGLQNKIIAAMLHLSEHTVKIHLHNIITKLGAHNRTEAAAIYHATPQRAATAQKFGRSVPRLS